MGESSGEKVIIPLAKCVPGMRIVQSIRDENTGMIIIGKDQILTYDILERLKKFKHTQVWVSLTSDQIKEEKIRENPKQELEGKTSKDTGTVWQISAEDMQTYKEYASVLETVLKDIRNNRAAAIEPLIELAEKIINDFSEEYRLLSCVHLLNQMGQNEYMHSVNVACTAFVLGQWMDYSQDVLKNIILASLLHDVGKLDINPMLYNKAEEEMTGMERLEFRRHPILSYDRLVLYHELSNEVLKAVLTHHERCDGSGYPLSLREDKISDEAKVIGLVDTYCELKGKYNIFKVVKILETKMIRKFEVNLLLQFCTNVMNYYVGSKVLLNTGEIGEVAFIQSQAIYRPIIKIGDEYINLYEKTHIDIVKVVE